VSVLLSLRAVARLFRAMMAAAPGLAALLVANREVVR